MKLGFLTPTIYWLLVICWGISLFIFLKKYSEAKEINKPIKIMLIIMIFDGIRTLFESLYFGIGFTAREGLFPKWIFDEILKPEWIIFPKVLNLIVALIILIMLLKKWLPSLYDEQQIQIKKMNDLRNAKYAIEENTRIREDVERIIHHDLKNPLNAIINIPELIQIKGELNDIQKEYLGYIQESGYTMLNIINMTLDLYKIEQGKYTLSTTKVDIYELIMKIINEFSSYLSKKKLEIKINEKEGKSSVFILGEKLLCYSLFANLIKNSIEASPENEIIRIFIYEINDFQNINIQNKGSVPENVKNNFFEKYITSGKKDGTGLGTYSSKLFVETMGGNISLNTSVPNETILSVNLPVYIENI